MSTFFMYLGIGVFSTALSLVLTSGILWILGTWDEPK